MGYLEESTSYKVVISSFSSLKKKKTIDKEKILFENKNPSTYRVVLDFGVWDLSKCVGAKVDLIFFFILILLCRGERGYTEHGRTPLVDH